MRKITETSILENILKEVYLFGRARHLRSVDLMKMNSTVCMFLTKVSINMSEKVKLKLLSVCSYHVAYVF